MWLCLPGAFISVVADRRSTENLLVRSRIAGHLEALFPHAEVVTTPRADYRYRSYINREEVADAVAASVRNIDYDNFKNSVPDVELHEAYFRFWLTMCNLQHKSLGTSYG